MTVSKRAILPAFSLNPRLEDEHFERIFHQHYPRIVELISRFTETVDEAEEIASDAFWKLWNSPPRNQDNLPGWLYRVATHLGYNALRAKRRRSGYEKEAGRKQLEEAASLDPQKAVELMEARHRVQSALKTMPERDVKLLLLRHSGVSYSEIANILQIHPSSIGKLLARAEEKFNKIYTAGEKDAPE